MPSVSRKQRKFFGLAEHHPNASAATKKVAKSMTGAQMHDFAATKEKGLPLRAKKTKKAVEPKKPKHASEKMRYL